MSMTMRRIKSMVPKRVKRFSDGIMRGIEGHT
jgi:hypothetical protein